MNKQTFTTGQILGITLLNRMSIYRYVKDFPAFFSPTAQQHKKGRRWNLNDLEVLQAIKYLHHTHNSREEIQEILTAGWRPAIKTVYDLERIATYFDELFAVSMETKETQKEIKKQLAKVEMNNQLASTMEKSITHLSTRLSEMNEELLKIKYYLKSPTKPQRREFFRVWQQFKNDLQKAWYEEEKAKE